MKTFYLKKFSDYNKEFGNRYWLHINNCGYFSNISKDITTSRNDPRPDFHLIYVSIGEVDINKMKLRSGDCYLFYPKELHHYTYKKTDDCRYFWIHFTGNKVTEILEQYQISKGLNRSNHRKHEKDALFAMLTEELSQCCGEPSDFATSLFFSFLSLFKHEQPHNHRYLKAIRSLQTPNNNDSIADLAGLYHVSAPHFIRSFKIAYGITPNEYRQNARINQAVQLLKTTDLSIQDIASQCGFNDPLYFSRAFKKKLGYRPSEFRKEIK